MKLIKCDTCGDNLITKFLGIPITISFGYGSNLDGEEYHFCSYKCLLKFVLNENKKENPRNDIITGGKK
jgi:YHS domain-containing protein